MDKYAYKFKKLLKKVDPNHRLPDTYVVQMFFKGLQGKTDALMSLGDPENLDMAIAAARRIKARNYYKKRNDPYHTSMDKLA